MGLKSIMRGLTAKYISVKRFPETGKVKNIIESPWNIDIEPNFSDSSIDYEIELITYPMKSSGQFAISFEDTNLNTPPYLMNEKKDIFELVAIKDSNFKEWWVEKNSFLGKSKSFMKSNLRNHIGKSYLIIPSLVGQTTILINVHDKVLDEGGMKLIMDAFRGEFYKLIYNKKGITSTGSVEDTDIEYLQLIDLKLVREFIKSLDNVVVKLHKSLVKSKNLESSERIKPDVDFLKQYVANPYKKYYESTHYSESVVNSVNGFLLYMAIEVRLLLLSMISNIIDPTLSSLESQLDIDFGKYIDENKSDHGQIIQNQINSINLNKRKNQENLDKLVDNFHINENNCNFDEVLHFRKKWKGDFSYAIYGNGSVSYRLPISIHNSIEEYSQYKVIGDCIESNRFPNYDIVKLNSIKKIELDTATNFSQLISNCSNTDFEFNNKYHEENKKTTSDLNRKNKKNLESLRSISIAYYDLIRDLKANISVLKSYGINSTTIKPTSLVYSNNEDYSKVLSLYYKIFNKEILNSLKYHKLFSNPLLSLELPKIYERWILIIILKTLIHKFKFKPSDDNWSHKVADIIYDSKDVKNVKITLVHNNGSYIDFFYEKEILVKGGERLVRPDYVLHFNRKNGDNNYCTYILVLDAKFYASINVLETVNDLKDNKDYKQGDNDNWVYIITSVSDLISNPLSNRIWSKQAYYGEAFLLNDTNDQLPNHRYGGIFLHPDVIKHPLNLDNLQRLFGMFLQTHGHNYCIACGLDHDGNPKENEFTNGVLHTCNNKKECGFKWTVNNCRKCHQPLYKNGFYWTYHMLSLNEPTKIDNIVCPECGDYFTSIRD